MARISPKCLLFFIIAIVVGLILVILSSKLSSKMKPPTPLYAKAGNPQALKNTGGKLRGQSFNYYDDLRDENKFRRNGVDDETIYNYKNGPQQAKDDGMENNLEEPSLDYPFGYDLRNNDPPRNHFPDKLKNKKQLMQSTLQDIICDINHGRYTINCKKDSNLEVYVPFSFLSKYYEMYGKLEEKGDQEQFTLLHSQPPKIFKPKAPYNPKGIFTFFDNYNVEVRERVKCISGSDGVPVSTQWDIKGYYYAIQIAQFGLSHFSKFLTEGEPRRLILEDGDEIRGDWYSANNNLIEILPNDVDPNSNHYVQFKTPASGNLSVSLKMPTSKPKMVTLSAHFHVKNGGQFPNVSITAIVDYNSSKYYLHYITADFLIRAKDNHIYHGLGFKSKSTWHHLIRDLSVDLQKGINLQIRKKSKFVKVAKAKVQLVAVSIQSSVPGTLIQLDNLTLSTNEHLGQFFQSADWFVSNQDSRGGWPIPVKRKFGASFYPVLEPGWYSAMGQGHALSLLARAYSITTNNSVYARACANAVATIFDMPGSQHGVKAVFMNRYVWYEEYPTTPSLFVLNGFMYALLGLYDVKYIQVFGASEKAAELYYAGLESLKVLLPLYDTGSGTVYDLRHFMVPGISPNLARLDYHTTHINQLLSFGTFENDKIFNLTARRWLGYTEGITAAHN